MGVTDNIGAAPDSLISTLNSTTTPLGAGATFTGVGEDVSQFGCVSVILDADQDSAVAGYKFQWSVDNTNWLDMLQIPRQFTVGQVLPSHIIPIKAQYFRIIYNNGATLQGFFRLQTIYHRFFLANVAPPGYLADEIPSANCVQQTTPWTITTHASSISNKGLTDSGNSTTTNLGINATFTGTGKDVSNYQVIQINVFADQRANANVGLQVQWSQEGTNWDVTEKLGRVSLSHGEQYIVPVRAQFFRVSYQNGGVAQTAFRLETILFPGLPIPRSSRALKNIYSFQTGAHLVLAAADAATVGRWWLINNDAATKLVLRQVIFTTQLGSALVAVTSPRIQLERFTFTGTPSGAVITPCLHHTWLGAPSGSLRTASTGLALTGGAVLHSFLPTASATAVGYAAPGTQVWPNIGNDIISQERIEVELEFQEGVILRQADAGTAADTRRYITTLIVEEW